jgi:hypothetical protein
MRKRNIPSGLKSSFLVTGRFKASSAEFVKHLQTVPSLCLSKGDENPTFLVTESDGRCMAELRVLGNKLVFDYWFERRSLKEYARGLIRFLSILAYARELYEADLASLYPSIMEVLAEHIEEMPHGYHKIENAELLVRRIRTLADMNCALSLKIIESQAQCERLKAERSVLERFSRDVIENASEKVGKAGQASEALPRVLGVTTDTYKSVLLLIFEKVW